MPRSAVKNSDPISQLSAYRCLVSDFTGVEDVGEYEKKLAELKQSAGLKTALKNERQQIDDQESQEEAIGSKLQAFVLGRF